MRQNYIKAGVSGSVLPSLIERILYFLKRMLANIETPTCTSLCNKPPQKSIYASSGPSNFSGYAHRKISSCEVG